MYTKNSALAAVAVLTLAACGGGGGGNTPTQPPPAPPPAADLWGMVGCSQSMNARRGYELIGGQRAWPAEAVNGYGGGDLINDWADPNDERWAIFQAALDEHGAVEIWWEICMVGARTDPTPTVDDLAAAEFVAEEIARRAPGLPIFVSGLSGYDPPTLCSKKGTAGTELTRNVADHVVAMGLAEAGPVLPVLTPELTDPDTDNCGATKEGMELLGMALLSFFG